MEAVLLYLLQSAAVLGAAYVFYFFVFRKETNYTVNRIFLIASAILSLVIPFAKFKSDTIVAGSEISVWLPLANINAKPVYNPSPVFNFTELALMLYLLVVIVLLLRFFLNLGKIVFTIKKNMTGPAEKSGNIIINKKVSPFSFFNFIFLPDDKIEEADLNYILAHELVHIKKYHSADKLFAEIITIMQWFNPFVYLFRKELTAQHELSADSEMIRRGADVSEYVNSLFEYSVLIPGSSLTNSYNSLLKRRLENMGRNPKVNIPFFKSVVSAIFIAIILATTGIINGCLSDNSVNVQPLKTTEAIPSENNGQIKTMPEVVAKKNNNQENSQETLVGTRTNKVYTFVEKMPQYPGGDEALINFLYGNIQYPQIAKRAGIEGRVIATFIVTEKGEVQDIKIVKGIGAGCDEETIRVLENMPNWKPGFQKGAPVKVRMSVPISFKLQE